MSPVLITISAWPVLWRATVGLVVLKRLPGTSPRFVFLLLSSECINGQRKGSGVSFSVPVLFYYDNAHLISKGKEKKKRLALGGGTPTTRGTVLSPSLGLVRADGRPDDHYCKGSVRNSPANNNEMNE